MLMLLTLTLTAYSQHYVTKFLGIPVDGSKSEMIRKLKAKGFQSTIDNDVLKGEFNGTNVNVSFGTNKNKVWRIAVWNEVPYDEQNARLHFNKLCEQFSNNHKYFAVENDPIPEDEKFAYEITVNNRQYEATFLQLLSGVDPSSLSEEQLARYKEDCLHRIVWFTIKNIGLSYTLYLYYENGYNQANGEDL